MLLPVLATLLATGCSETPATPEFAENATFKVAATSLSIAPAHATVLVGDTLRLVLIGGEAKGRPVAWTSSDGGVASVSADGLLTALNASPEPVVITAASQQSAATAQVVVQAPVKPLPVATLVVSPAALDVPAGSSSAVTVIALDANGGILNGVPVQWSSTDSAVASVAGAAASGGSAYITGIATGSAVVSASAGAVVGTVSITVSGGEVVGPLAVTATNGNGVWIGRAELMALPTSGAAWTNLKSAAGKSCGVVNLADQNQNNNVCIMAKALVYARVGGSGYRTAVLAALRSVAGSGTYQGTALALGRELAAYVIAADLINLAVVDPALDAKFRTRIRALLTTRTSSGPDNLIKCHEQRPNNWGTHCGASRIAVAAYLNDSTQLKRAAQVFSGWLGQRAAYAGFSYGDLSWQCNRASPVGINPTGCMKSGHLVDGVLPDDQRRAGTFAWPPPKENYVYEALQGALAQAVMLSRRGYDVWNTADRALLRAYNWLHQQASFPATGDDGWQPHLVNKIYGTSFPEPVPARPGKNVGWTDWTHQ